jgi:hypothetical protein
MRAPARYASAILSLAGATALPLTAWAVFSPEDAAALRTALAGKAVVESGLVPRGFAKVAEAKGDLNGDGTDDLALIVRRAAKQKRGQEPSEDEYEVPQAVLIFAGDKSASTRSGNWVSAISWTAAKT